MFRLCLAWLTILALSQAAQAHGADPRPRLLVLTDIGGDPDDQQSLVRLLYYLNEFEIEGLIASASGTPGELKEKVTKPQLIRDTVEAYAQVRTNLSKHAAGYPTAEALLDKVKSGNPQRGQKFLGEKHDTEGSRKIIELADRKDDRPLNITIWGGQTDLAQALWRVRADRGPDGLSKFLAKVRVYDINDQDKIVEWIWEEFPGLFYILASAPAGRDKREGAYRGMYLGGDESLVSREWMDTNIRNGHGPLAAIYPPRTWTAPNPHAAMKEGDTPSWLYFLPHGINEPAHPEWGSWGGRFRLEDRQKGDGSRLYRDAKDRAGEVEDARATVWRWRRQFQADFQARLDWGLADTLEKVNHPPMAVLNGEKASAIVKIETKARDRVHLSSEGSADPDGHSLKVRWYDYPEAGTYRGPIDMSPGEGGVGFFEAPNVTEERTIHVILEVTDNGTPPLTAARRAIVTVRP